MAKEQGNKGKTTQPPRGNAAGGKSSAAGKRAGQGKKAARVAPPKAPADKRGRTSGSKNVANDQSRQTAPKPAAEKKQNKGKTSGLFKFRRYKKIEGGEKKKARHPKLIVEQKENIVGFMGLTESAKRGHHKNIELDKNPQKGNTDKAFLRKEIRYSDIDNFGEILKDYNLSKADKQKVLEYIEELKKKK